MKTARKIIICLILIFTSSSIISAGEPQDKSENLLTKRLDWFQNQKFGFMVHWGAYSQWGGVESWGLSLDLPKIRRENWNSDINVFRDAYWKLNRTFYPMEFDPAEWVDAAKDAGMKYFVFTTKHHDGFAMFDTKLSDYKITGPDCPYSKHPEPDVTARLFEAFRRAGFGIGAYFSKADWHSPFFWKPNTPAPDRNVNYNITEEPERWQRFVDFVHGQVEELVTGYGKIDILWFDSGWIRPSRNHQDIQMPRLASMARSRQPHLIFVDRTVGGPYENYKTPEKRVPETPLDGPWETCMTMAESWSFKPYDNYKSTRELVHMLADVVAKGGNLLLNVGPMANGKLPPPAVTRMQQIGAWMKINGEAIYGTRPVAPYKENNICLTKKGSYVYAIYLDREENETLKELPGSITLQSVKPVPGSAIHLLGIKEALEWQRSDGGIRINIPESLRQSPPCKYAYTFRIQAAE